MDALVMYSSSESEDEYENYLSHGTVAADDVPAICSEPDGIKSSEGFTTLLHSVNQTNKLQPCHESCGTSAADDVCSAAEQIKVFVTEDIFTVAEQTNVSVAVSAVTTSAVKDFFSLAQQRTCSVDELPVTSAVEDFFKPTKRKNVSSDESTVTCAPEDFFNLTEPTCVSTADDLRPAQLVCDSKQQSTTQNTCTIDFWNTDMAAVDWTHPEKIWGVTYNLAKSGLGHASSKSVNVVSNSEVQKIKGYSSKRHHSDISDELLVSAENSLPVKKSCFTVHHKIAPHLHTVPSSTNRIPNKVLRVLPGHSGTVNRIHWGTPEYSHLLLTASMDTTVRVWNVLSSRDSDPCVRTLKVHSKAVKAARWSPCGRQILSCSYDKFAKLTDVECGTVFFQLFNLSLITLL